MEPENNNELVAQPEIPSSQISSKKKKIILIFAFIAVVGIVIGLVILYPKVKNKLQDLTNCNVNSASQEQRQVYQPVITNTNLSDSQSILYYSVNQTLFAQSLDDSSPREVAELPGTILSLDPLMNGKLSLTIDASSYRKKIDTTGKTFYSLVTPKTEIQVYDPQIDALVDIDESKEAQIPYLKTNIQAEKYYSKELPSGQAEIVLDSFNGNKPEIIGRLQAKLIQLGCEGSSNCSGKIHPSEFYPSLDGSYLLNKPPSGGGLGQSAVVVSRDGSDVYPIDFYWFVSSAVWVGNNQLLTRGQSGDSKVYTFEPGGKITEKKVAFDLGGLFTAMDVSPSKKYVVISSNNDELMYFDIAAEKLVPIANYDHAAAYKKLKLSSNARLRHYFTFLAWNLSSNKILFSENYEHIPDNASGQPIQLSEIKLYDLVGGKVTDLYQSTNVESENSLNAYVPAIQFSLR